VQVVSDYRPAIAGAIVSILAWGVSTFAGVDIPAEVGAAAVTVVVFGLGFVPKPKPDPPAPE
jgi:hypothetical protein